MSGRAERLLVRGLGPVTVLPAWKVRVPERARACSPLEARRLIWGAAAQAARGEPRDLLTLAAALGGHVGEPVAALTARLLSAVDHQKLFVFHGWGRGDDIPEKPKPRLRRPPSQQAPAPTVTAPPPRPLQRATFDVTSLRVPSAIASGAETIEIRYTFADPDRIAESAELQLFAREQIEPIWTRGVPADHLAAREGKLTWDGALDVTDEVFPDGFATLEGSPYRLRLTGRGGGREAFRECRIEVLVHEVVVELAPAEHLVHARDREVHAQVGTLPGLIKLRLEGNAYDQNDRLPDTHDAGYSAFRAIWEAGAGPRLPLVATVRVWDSAGKGVRAGRALGRAKALWDYAGGSRLPNFSDDDRPFVERIRLAEADQARPRRSENALARFGGKRQERGAPAAASSVLTSPDEGTKDFPHAVAMGRQRSWSAFSALERTGSREAQAGVVFRPSIIAGDTFKVTVRIGTEADLDVDGELPSDAREWRVGEFHVERRITLAKRIVKCPAVLPVALKDPSPYFRVACVEVENRLAENVEVLTKEEYERLFEAARRVTGVHPLLWRYSLPSGISQYDEMPIGTPLQGLWTPTTWVATFRSPEDFFRAVARGEGWSGRKTLSVLMKEGLAEEEGYGTATAFYAMCLAATMAAMLAVTRGVTVLQFVGTQAFGPQWGGTAAPKNPNPADRDKSGLALYYHSAHVSAHELGHCLFLPHAPTLSSDVQPDGVKPRRHVPGSVDCLMSYTRRARNFCGVCLLRLAGYDGDRVQPPPAPILP